MAMEGAVFDAFLDLLSASSSFLVGDSIARLLLLLEGTVLVLTLLDLEAAFVVSAFFLEEEEKKFKREDCCFGFAASSSQLSMLLLSVSSLTFFFAGSPVRMLLSFGGDMIHYVRCLEAVLRYFRQIVLRH